MDPVVKQNGAEHAAPEPQPAPQAQPAPLMASEAPPSAAQTAPLPRVGMAASAESGASAPPPAAPPSAADAAPAPAAASAEKGSRLHVWLLGALAAVLLLTLGLGSVYAKTLIDRRDATIAQTRKQVADLTSANQGLQDQVKSLTGERDSLTQQRDALTKERDGLNGKVADLQKLVSSLQASLSDKDRQLSQAREEGSRQQQRAENAEATRNILVKVVAIDDQIHDELGRLLDAAYDLDRANAYGDVYAAQDAYDRLVASSNSLDALFQQRAQLMAQLQ